MTAAATSTPMLPLGVRLTLRGGREPLVRLAVTGAAVGLGVLLLLATLASLGAVGRQNDRYAWLTTGPAQAAHGADHGADVDPLWWQLRADVLDGTTVGRVDLAATGARSPVPPGIPAVPRAGEMYVSPALAALLADDSSGALATRYGAVQVGIIGQVALPSPDSLLVVVGHAPQDLASSPHALQVSSISTTSPDRCDGDACAVGVGMNRNAISLVLGVVVVALLVPLLVFTGSATRLSAARREQRFAAMRLVGATPRQVAVAAAVESVITAAVGTVVGFLLWWALRGTVAQVPFTGERFQVADLTVGPATAVVVAFGVPLAAAVTARFAMRRVVVSPLGVVRRQTSAPPSAWRLLLLVTGLAVLGAVVVVGPPAGTGAQLVVYLGGVAAVMVGLVVAGPWLTMVGARLLVARASRPEVLLAGRRLADDPRGAFRAVSGLVLAVLVGTLAVGTMTGFAAERGPAAIGPAAAATLVQDLDSRQTAGVRAADPPAPLLDELQALLGVAGAAVVREGPADTPPELEEHWGQPGYVACDDLARVPSFGRCAPGASVALVALDRTADTSGVVWPAADLAPAEIATLAPSAVLVGTDGSPVAVEHSRTLLERTYPQAPTARTVGEMRAEGTSELAAYERLAEVIVAISLVIAGCSLAVNLAGGLSERRRPFSLLRLVGVPLSLLQRVVALEAGLPLLVGTAVAMGTGFLSAQLFLTAQLDYPLRAPAATYWWAVGLGLAGALGIVVSTFPLLRRITGPEAVRNE